MSQLNVNIIKNRVGNNGPTISGNTTVSGILTATKFVGDGSSLTNINAGGDGTLDSLVVTGVSTFNGNVTIGGTLTYQDVTSIDAIGMVTARKGIQVLADGLTVTGVSTLSNGAFIPDNQYLNIGNDSDLRLYHTSSTSVIEDQGTGNFIIGSNGGQLKITKGNDQENIASFVTDGPVNLYYDNVRKFETTDAGVNIIGVTTTSNLVVTNSALTAITTTTINKTIVNREFCTVIGVGTTALGITVTLPASPQPGWLCGVGIGGTFLDTEVGRNGSNIMNLSEDFKIDVAHINVSFLYVDNTYGWKVV